MTPPRMRLRISATDEAELYCHGCREWLPVSIEFWPGRTGSRLFICRACKSDRELLNQARKRFDPEWRQKQIAKSARYRAFLKGADPALAEAALAERRERTAARQRAVRAQTSAAKRTREYKAAWQRVRRAEQAA